VLSRTQDPVLRRKSCRCCSEGSRKPLRLPIRSSVEVVWVSTSAEVSLPLLPRALINPLTICLRASFLQVITGLMNGRIEVDSVRGEGSTFRFFVQSSIPAANQAPDPTVARSSISAKMRPLKVLIVEDNAVNARVLTRQLFVLLLLLPSLTPLSSTLL
jgi:hypothetical protein